MNPYENEDSISIELARQASPLNKKTSDTEKMYKTAIEVQGSSLVWLVDGLSAALKIPLTEVFRHPTVSYKNPTEASTAKWQSSH
jgi:hypothetical protein